MKKKKQSGGNREYILLFAVICVFSFVVFIISLVFFEKFGREPDTANMLLPDTSDSDILPINASDSDTPDVPGEDLIFRVTDAKTLYMLAEADTFEEFYSLHVEEPIVVIDDSISLDRTLDIHGGICLIMEDYVTFVGDDIKIRITAEGARRISISSDEPISRFEIDAPESALYLDGGDIPFIHEVAETQNVASYNGTSVRGTADGDTLGGTGRGTVSEVTVFRDKAQTEVWDGMYSRVSGYLITLYIPHDANDKDVEALSLSVTADGGECDMVGIFDLTSPKLIDVTDSSGGIRTYRISAERTRLGIPILEIYTDDGSEIDSKEVYKTAVMRLDGREYTLRIKGRGNSSWDMFPKHSYRLKLDSKAELCGMTADRDWCLIGNYVDPSLLRNKVASDMAKIMTALPFTPGYESVDLFINGEYLGIFMLSEKIEDDEDRVPLGERVTGTDGNILDMGFLIEFGWDYSSENVYAKNYFDTTYCERMYIKEPEIVNAYNVEYRYACLINEDMEKLQDLGEAVSITLLGELFRVNRGSSYDFYRLVQ